MYGLLNHLFITNLTRGSYSKKDIQYFLKIPGNSFKTIIQRSYNLLIYILLSHSEMMPSKFDIFLPINSCQMKNRHTLIKRTGRADKHLSHQMTLRTGKHKAGIRTMLNIGTEQCFRIFFRILSDLLKLINCNNTRFV